ncbi:MAG: alkaline phosphatase family protein [Flavobacteriales bacterium]|nr:alkaline phosphatase family protein [Flavobacteriales bacterium]
MDRIKLILLGLIMMACGISTAQKPKLVVGIVVDQMRYDYLTLYWNKFEEGGFKRLVNEGYNCKNMHYNFVPTYTGPGHAAIYTGTTPATNGIISNNWYDIVSEKVIYCVDDSTQTTVGSESVNGKKSSHLNLTTTFTDELKLSNKYSKVISISLKDRGAVLPAGHFPDGAFWFDNETGNWISSTAFVSELPKWVVDYNATNRTKEFLSNQWTTLLEIDKYNESDSDLNNYESALDGEEKPIFPHDLKALFTGQNWDLIKYTPFGNTITRELAIAAIKAEQLGKDDNSDILAVSFSATDYVGHRFGPQSIEHQDTYLRLDKDIAALLAELDKQVGKENYVVFLTADHGAVRVPNLLIDNNIPAGYFNSEEVLQNASLYLSKIHGKGNWIDAFSNYQFFLNIDLLQESDVNIGQVEKELVQFSMSLEGVSNAYTSNDLRTGKGGKPMSLIQLGYNQKRSGHVAVALAPGWISYGPTGTTHGSPYTYDTHVPMLWYGADILKGSTAREMYITDIASTIGILLDISFPNGNMGKPILEVVE